MPEQPIPFAGIQIGAVSFVDEGVETVLDLLAERGGVNALMLATPTFTRGTGGRQIPGHPLPDHGVQQYDPEFRGGSYTAVDPRYFGGTMLYEGLRAPELGKWDLFQAVLPAARARGFQCYAWVEESAGSPLARYLPNFPKVLELDVYGRKAPTPCFNHPDYRQWHLSIIEAYLKSYDLDGIMWCSERCGPLDRLLHGPTEARSIV
ncbi:MAG TPA: hypothetical protein VF234_05860, partial [Limnochordia bacterium]